MAELLDDDKLEEIKDTFAMFDVDDKGVLPLKELGTLLRALGEQPTEAELEDMALQIQAISNAVPPPDPKPPAESEDGAPPSEAPEGEQPLEKAKSTMKVDLTGTLDLKSFLSICGKKLSKERDKEAELQEAFRMIDKDRTGTISAAALRHIMVTLGEKLDDEEADEMINEADTDHDGQVQWEEFCAILLDMDK